MMIYLNIQIVFLEMKKYRVHLSIDIESSNLQLVPYLRCKESIQKSYANNSKGMISQTIKKFGITQTILDDVDEEYLYPSQAWASISTGLNAESHKIRWYNDAKPSNNFYWRDLAKQNKKIALMNVLHSGSISKDEENLYDFIFTDPRFLM